MKRILSVLLIAHWLVTGWVAADEPYGYPFDDKYIATVVGTPPKYMADLPKKIPVSRGMTIFPDRQVPDYLWYESELRYS